VKVVGLRIEKGLIAAALVQKAFHQMELLDSFIQPFATDGELIEILKDKSRDWTGARIISSIPGYHFSQRIMGFPFADRKRVEKALPFEVEDSVPFPLDDVIIDHIVLGKEKTEKDAEQKQETPVLGIMLPKEVLRRHLELLASAGIDPQVVVPSYVGLYAVSSMIRMEGSDLLICGRDLCLMRGGAVKSIRSFSDSGATGGLRHTLLAIEAEQKEKVEKASLLCGDGDLEVALTEMGITVGQAVPELRGKKAADPVSLGLAMTVDMNFRRGEFTYHLADEGARRRKRTLIIAGAAAAVLFAVNLGVKIYMVRTTYGKLDGEIRQIYRQTFPDAKSTVDPVRQLRSSLAEARKKFGVLGSGGSALDVMRAVTDGIPKEVSVSFQEFNLEGDRLKLQGDAGSFDSVDRIKAELQKSDQFAEVVVLDTRMGVDNKVKFRMDIKLKHTM
jgi:general secretion pathway protein L